MAWTIAACSLVVGARAASASRTKVTAESARRAAPSKTTSPGRYRGRFTSSFCCGLEASPRLAPLGGRRACAPAPAALRATAHARDLHGLTDLGGRCQTQATNSALWLASRTEGGAAQLPRKCGARFSRNARDPSAPSAVLWVREPNDHASDRSELSADSFRRPGGVRTGRGFACPPRTGSRLRCAARSQRRSRS
jgi:hypothetical protein